MGLTVKIEIPRSITPQPPEEIVRRLRQVNPHLGVRFVHSCLEPYWALTWDWPENDPRRRGVLAGDVDPANCWDLLCMLPLDCSVDDAYGYFVNHCRRATREEIRGMLDRITAYNSENTAKVWEPTMREAMEEIERSSSKLFRDSKSFLQSAWSKQ